jgi:hypothetical protein
MRRTYWVAKASTSWLKEAAEKLVEAAYLDVKVQAESAAAKEIAGAIEVGNDRLVTLDNQVASVKESTSIL